MTARRRFWLIRAQRAPLTTQMGRAFVGMHVRGLRPSDRQVNPKLAILMGFAPSGVPHGQNLVLHDPQRQLYGKLVVDANWPELAESGHGVIAPAPHHREALLRFGYSARRKRQFGACNEMINNGIYCEL